MSEGGGGGLSGVFKDTVLLVITKKLGETRVKRQE